MWSQVMIGEDTLIRFSGCKAGEACTIVLRGARCDSVPALVGVLGVCKQTVCLEVQRCINGSHQPAPLGV